MTVVMATTMVGNPDSDPEDCPADDQEIREMLEEAKRVDELFKRRTISTVKNPASIAKSLLAIARRYRKKR